MFAFGSACMLNFLTIRNHITLPKETKVGFIYTFLFSLLSIRSILHRLTILVYQIEVQDKINVQSKLIMWCDGEIW